MTELTGNPIGRPSNFTLELADAICERLAAGESLLAICRDANMPAESTVRGWVLDDRGGFSAKYARARELQADHNADEVIDIADTEKDPQVARVRIDARKWHASKVAPRKYGDKVAVVGGDPEDQPIRAEVNVTDRDRAKAVAALVAKSRGG